MRTYPRRTFLRHSLVAAAACGLLPTASFGQEKSRARFGLGFSLYGMKSLPLEEAIQTCAQIGYDNIELCLLEGYPTEPKLLTAAARTRLREVLGAQKMRVSGLMENFTLLADEAKHGQQLERIKTAAELAHELAPQSPPPLETVLGGKPAEWDQVKDKMVGQLRAWAKTAEAAGIVIAIKAHIMSAVQNPDRLLWLMQASESSAIRLAYDFSHFELQGLALTETLTSLLPHTRFIHVKDGRMTADGKVEFLLPGEGSTDYGALFQQLQNAGYSGDVVVEVSGMIFKKPEYNPVNAARQSLTALAGGLEKAGLQIAR